jgi:hypothetical protein
VERKFIEYSPDFTNIPNLTNMSDSDWDDYSHVLLERSKKDALFREIERYFSLNDDETIPRYYEFKEYFLDYLYILFKNCKSFIFEKNYNDNYWSELYSLHYSKTTYSNSGKAMRIHLFSDFKAEKLKYDNEYDFIKKNYLGFITLRPVLDYSVMLSSVVPNWGNKKIDFGKEGYIMTYERKIHIGPHEIEVKTFSLFHQDGVVTKCAHADMLMLSYFMNRKGISKKLKIADTVETLHYNPLPNTGLLGEDMLRILHQNDIPTKIYLVENPDDNDKKINIAKTYIESGLPLIVYEHCNDVGHCVVVIGHTKDDEFIIYDDSGAYFESSEGNRKFVGSVNKEKLFSFIQGKYFIAANLEGVYIYYEDYVGRLNEYIKSLENIDLQTPKRSLLLLSSDVKTYLAANVADKDTEGYQKNSLCDILSKNFPMYLWCTIFDNIDKDVDLFFCADSTYNKYTIQNIFQPYLYCNSNNRKLIERLTAIS